MEGCICETCPTDSQGKIFCWSYRSQRERNFACCVLARDLKVILLSVESIGVFVSVFELRCLMVIDPWNSNEDCAKSSLLSEDKHPVNSVSLESLCHSVEELPISSYFNVRIAGMALS
ncbi:hypothetical protein TNIN_244391 [Trichonephila inaurata madagascariensis]|uniref:Uncharacterized protein n=1 Tax=Trichonephila inaurata madagascariensis TaxID=2747483 RepID=A0A8X6WNI7_9ARAC|nr:hypothetical protein TNIN_244391 [Trichonephila inaurata madagascariensis]